MPEVRVECVGDVSTVTSLSGFVLFLFALYSFNCGGKTSCSSCIHFSDPNSTVTVSQGPTPGSKNNDRRFPNNPK